MAKAGLQAELEMLRAKVAQLESVPKSAPNSILDEIGKARRIAKKQGQANNIQVRDVDDHKNITLYTWFNKHIVVHPANAVAMMSYYYGHGIELFTAPRTQEQIEEYKSRPDVKARLEANRKRREKMKRRSSGDSVEEIGKIIAQETGRAVASLTQVKERV